MGDGKEWGTLVLKQLIKTPKRRDQGYTQGGDPTLPLALDAAVPLHETVCQLV